MKLNQPILTNWQKGPMAAYIRRHRYFFQPGGNHISSYQLYFIVLPALVSALFMHSSTLLISIWLVLTLAHLAAAFVLVGVALEKKRD